MVAAARRVKIGPLRAETRAPCRIQKASPERRGRACRPLVPALRAVRKRSTPARRIEAIVLAVWLPAKRAIRRRGVNVAGARPPFR